MQKKLSLKILLIAFIATALMLPLEMIDEKISERHYYLEDAKHSVAQNWTGTQRLLTPILAVPYITEHHNRVYDGPSDKYKISTVQRSHLALILAKEVKIDADLNTDTRHKGIYPVPVYSAALSVRGHFDRAQIASTLAQIEAGDSFKRFATPYLSSVVSDARGIGNAPQLTWNKQRMPFAPGSQLKADGNGIHAVLPLSALRSSGEGKSKFSFEINLRGMEQLSFIPVAAQSTVSVKSNWAHPSFIGNFLPLEREIDNSGYRAQWQISSFASNINEKLNTCARGDCNPLMASQFGVKQIEPVSIYVQAERSVKYGVLFIGLSFIAFFIFEVIKKLPIHAIQYTLVGFAIAMFYLLLISLSEHIPFAAAYAIASLCCISLLFYYLRYVLQGTSQALLFASLIALLYGALYVIISAEDFALLMGALLTFVTLAVVMISTRNIDWYNLVEPKRANKTEQVIEPQD